MSTTQNERGHATSGLIEHRPDHGAPTFTFGNRLKRLLWGVCWQVFFRLSPTPLHRYRMRLLRLFGAQVSLKARVYPGVRVWAPWNLVMDDYATMGPGVQCYNMATITLRAYALASQGAFLCTSSHDYNHPRFPLYSRPICLETHAWACAESFVGPGVTLREGAVLGARGVTFKDLPPWSVSAGNPARVIKSRNPVTS